jgi:hypothetical protein
MAIFLALAATVIALYIPICRRGGYVAQDSLLHAN